MRDSYLDHERNSLSPQNQSPRINVYTNFESSRKTTTRRRVNSRPKNTSSVFEDGREKRLGRQRRKPSRTESLREPQQRGGDIHYHSHRQPHPPAYHHSPTKQPGREGYSAQVSHRITKGGKNVSRRLPSRQIYPPSPRAVEKDGYHGSNLCQVVAEDVSLTKLRYLNPRHGNKRFVIRTVSASSSDSLVIGSDLTYSALYSHPSNLSKGSRKATHISPRSSPRSSRVNQRYQPRVSLTDSSSQELPINLSNSHQFHGMQNRDSVLTRESYFVNTASAERAFPTRTILGPKRSVVGATRQPWHQSALTSPLSSSTSSTLSTSSTSISTCSYGTASDSESVPALSSPNATQTPLPSGFIFAASSKRTPLPRPRTTLLHTEMTTPDLFDVMRNGRAADPLHHRISIRRVSGNRRMSRIKHESCSMARPPEVESYSRRFDADEVPTTTRYPYSNSRRRSKTNRIPKSPRMTHPTYSPSYSQSTTDSTITYREPSFPYKSKETNIPYKSRETYSKFQHMRQSSTRVNDSDEAHCRNESDRQIRTSERELDSVYRDKLIHIAPWTSKKDGKTQKNRNIRVRDTSRQSSALGSRTVIRGHRIPLATHVDPLIAIIGELPLSGSLEQYLSFPGVLRMKRKDRRRRQSAYKSSQQHQDGYYKSWKRETVATTRTGNRTCARPYSASGIRIREVDVDRIPVLGTGQRTRCSDTRL